MLHEIRGSQGSGSPSRLAAASESDRALLWQGGVYRNSRPHYPPGILTALEEQCGLTAGSLIVDVGAGTGLLAELFLKSGNPVIAVEPNGAMRGALTTLRSSYPRLTPVDAVAEAIPLGNHSVDFITVGTAFHWFDSRQSAWSSPASSSRADGW